MSTGDMLQLEATSAGLAQLVLATNARREEL